jgi:hypothetical protein
MAESAGFSSYQAKKNRDKGVHVGHDFSDRPLQIKLDGTWPTQ